jgi:hypothetical protein
MDLHAQSDGRPRPRDPGTCATPPCPWPRRRCRARGGGSVCVARRAQGHRGLRRLHGMGLAHDHGRADVRHATVVLVPAPFHLPRMVQSRAAWLRCTMLKLLRRCWCCLLSHRSCLRLLCFLVVVSDCCAFWLGLDLLALSLGCVATRNE